MISKITEAQYTEAVGIHPAEDDLERCNCPDAGTLGHELCGWNTEMNLPIFITGRNKTLTLT